MAINVFEVLSKNSAIPPYDSRWFINNFRCTQTRPLYYETELGLLLV